MSAPVEDKWRRGGTIRELDVKVNTKRGQDSIAVSFGEAQNILYSEFLQAWYIGPYWIEEGGFSDKNAASESQLFERRRKKTRLSLRPKHAQVKRQLSQPCTPLCQACQEKGWDKLCRLEESFFSRSLLLIKLDTAEDCEVDSVVAKERKTLLMQSGAKSCPWPESWSL